MASQSQPSARELECGVCLEVLRDPRMLDCSHTFCRACLQGLTGFNTQSIICPRCHQSTTVPPGGVGALMSNPLVVQGIAEASPTTKPGSKEVGLSSTDTLEEEKWRLDFTFGMHGSEIGQFNCAACVAVSPSGDMAITEHSSRTCIFGTDGKHKLTVTGKSSANPDRGDRDVAFLSDGRCLILAKRTIDVYDRDGGFLDSIRIPARISWCLAVDAADTIYLGTGDIATNVIIHHVYVMMVDGSVTREIKVAHRPLGLKVDDKGHILVSSAASKRVDMLNIATGEALTSIFSASVDPSNLVQPVGACFGPEGSIFVTFSGPTVPQGPSRGTVHEFSRDGRHLGCVARGLYEPQSAAFTRDGRLIVVCSNSIKLYRKV